MTSHDESPDCKLRKDSSMGPSFLTLANFTYFTSGLELYLTHNYIWVTCTGRSHFLRVIQLIMIDCFVYLFVFFLLFTGNYNKWSHPQTWEYWNSQRSHSENKDKEVSVWPSVHERQGHLFIHLFPGTFHRHVPTMQC